jgi:opacity protein-like surface antigen
MNRLFMAVMVLGLGLMLFSADLQAGEHRIGGGANYWVAVDDIDDDNIDDDGFSYLVSYQHWWDFLGLEVDMELLPDRFGEDAFAPEAYLLFGSTIYAGAGIGIMNSDGDFADEPFYALRAGVNLELLPKVFVDISANYRFNDTDDLKNNESDIDTDTIFLGAAVRFGL